MTALSSAVAKDRRINNKRHPAVIPAPPFTTVMDAPNLIAASCFIRAPALPSARFPLFKA